MIYGKENIRCGLLGEKLSHSFSPQIHKRLADYSYTLFEVQASNLANFLKSDRFDAINVTIPYKKAVIPFLDEISEQALKIGSVNTVIKLKNGGLRGENTDYFGFYYLVKQSGIEIENKKVLILGTGGASLTAQAVSSDLGAQKVTFVSRNGEVNYESVYSICSDFEVIINCTPVGMYPNNLNSPIDLEKFNNCQGVIDMIYNPQKTKLLLDAERLSIPSINGLPMLVAQAKKASELFLDCKIDDGKIASITKEISNDTSNIILVGMPGCGKTTIGTMLAEKLNRKLIDTDQMIVNSEGENIPSIFEKYGEDYFRACECRAIADAGKMSGAIISTGGGCVTRAENLEPLVQNGKIFFIKRDLSMLDTDGRPLSKANKLVEMYRKRLPLYRKFCDFEVENNAKIEDCVEEIIKLHRKDKDL